MELQELNSHEVKKPVGREGLWAGESPGGEPPGGEPGSFGFSSYKLGREFTCFCTGERSKVSFKSVTLRFEDVGL